MGRLTDSNLIASQIAFYRTIRQTQQLEKHHYYTLILTPDFSDFSDKEDRRTCVQSSSDSDELPFLFIGFQSLRTWKS
jgi:hypothetical protein